MFFNVIRWFLLLLTFIDYNYAAAKSKNLVPWRKVEKRHKRSIDGNVLPPLPITRPSDDNRVPIPYREGGQENSQQDSRRDYTGVGTRDYDYRQYPNYPQHQGESSQPPTASGGMVNIGSDPQIEFRSHIETSDRNVGRVLSSSQDYPTTRGGYRYTSTVYSGPGSQTSYRYQPPYDQLGSQGQSQYNTGTGSTSTGGTQYSPYVGSGVSYNPAGSRVQYVGGGGRYPIYNRNERVYGGSSNYIPNRGVLSNDPNCPSDTTNVYINNMGCTQAISALGSFICYNYERVSRECCERCLSLKKATNTGCEYGDWSYQCRNIQPFDCYNDRNRDICCETCRLHRERQVQVIPGCEYGDLTPRCQIIREKRHLCYLPENQRLCCVTCPSLSDQGNSVCKWGDQNPDLCRPFDQQGELRINCYMPTVQQICCESCERLKSRFRNQIAGCEYGDRPVSFNTAYGILDCGNYISRFGVEVCNNPDVSTHCCNTCYRYRLQSQSGKK